MLEDGLLLSNQISFAEMMEQCGVIQDQVNQIAKLKY
jgi:hypothetical protein